MPENAWQTQCVVLVQLCTDWKAGHGYAKPKLPHLRRGKLMHSAELLQDTTANRIEIASRQGRNYLPVAVYCYADILQNKGKAVELYRVDREDHDTYMKWADEQDWMADETPLMSR